MLPREGDDDVEFGFDEASPAEEELAPEQPSVENYEDRFPEPDADDFGLGADLDPRTYRTFIICVLLSNVALFCVSLGAMLVYFRGQWSIGLGLAGLGVLAGIRTLQHYRSWQQYRRERDAADVDGDESDASKSTDPTPDGSQP
ncbi:DUF7322 domain-containing protein [Halopenitus persicus]|uniref:DUF7322 domain-containing protein n=1 Tax=Halopenitus persicus TaxID=1048396 RepID=A0A1H3IK16_9EURY|nr:hypothetical protein [Halopenitus persicus]QHS17132.1 hypothetical protein GWK26_08240 [haloarchaeon 3A1-DGR]SDY27927.1 hypothetical protein SAMN05216564_104154 [Halopenitus persicus]